MSNIYGTLLSSVTVGAGGASSIDFTSIPQTGTDLILVFSLRSSANNLESVQIWTNGSFSATTRRNLTAIDGTVSSDTNFLVYAPGPGVTSNTFGNGIFYMSNYTSSTAKAIAVDSVSENNATTNVQQVILAGLDPKTTAITSLSIKNGSGNWVQYSTASLYILTKGSGGATVS